MNGYRSNSLDQFWLCFVLIHIVSSCMVSILAGSQAGRLLFSSVLWIYCAYVNKSRRAGIFLCAIGWSVTLFMISVMAISYAITFAMNLILFTYILYLHYGSFSLLFSENHVKSVRLKDISVIVILTVFVLLIGEYINALSVIVFHNYVSSSISSHLGDLWSGILVFAVSSALVEEIMFRGYVFQRIGRNKKAILCSAIMFSLGHMNFNQMCYAFVIGLLFALIYYVTDNLSISIGIHGMFNAYNVLVEVFSENRIMKKILDFKLGGYAPFCASVTDSDGKMLLSLMLIGCLFTIISLAAILVLLHILKKKDPIEIRLGKEEKWKPGIMFFVISAICLSIAILREI